ncbi:hypothetical protein [Ruegeria arenilitoris]|uniref:hypothetical protein n=1 Tax=Ruegeria arenilitoris TaxID=1173585 RepID=UPI00147F63F6|nr:hypothetical protein [Ruegeria arenilitoris]
MMDLNFYSLEATGKTIADLTTAAPLIPARNPVNVAWLNDEDDYDRLRTVRQIDDAGLLPVPIFAAYRLKSKKQLFEGIPNRMVSIDDVSNFHSSKRAIIYNPVTLREQFFLPLRAYRLSLLCG